MNDLQTRIYVELTPNETARGVLAQVSKEVKLSIKGRMIDPSIWHISIIHFGVAEHVFYDIQRDLPYLGKQTFLQAMDSYIQRAQKSLPKPMSLQPTGFELFGVNENVLVLTLEPNEEIREAHKIALADVMKFLSECGIQDPEYFMKGSINFKWALELKPHITLARGVAQANIPVLKVPKSKLLFESASIHGI